MDELYEDALRIIRDANRVGIRPTTSILQRRLRIGYARAAALLDRMVADGVITATHPRQVLKPVEV